MYLSLYIVKYTFKSKENETKNVIKIPVKLQVVLSKNLIFIIIYLNL